MDLRGAAKGLDQAFYCILLGILALYSLMHLFVFILNWETWFFGIKMDGLNAGIILFIYFIVSFSLAILLLKYPRKMTIITLLSVFFFSFTFLDSSANVRELSGGLRTYTWFMAMLMIVPLVVLAGHIITARFYDREEDQDDNEKGEAKVFKVAIRDESGNYSIKQILILAIAAFVVVLMFGILVVIPAIILLIVLIVLKITKKVDKPEKKEQMVEFNITGLQILLVITIVMALYLLSLIVIPVFFLLITR